MLVSISAVGKVLLGKELKRNSVKELVLGQDGRRGLVLCWDGAVHDKPSVCEGVRVQEMLVGI